jgi:hypothetical protein
MRHRRHALLPAEDLQPTFTPAGEDPSARSGRMRQLRELSNAIAGAYRERDQLLLALATSQTLTRRDMATACGLAKSRVDQIILELAQADEDRRNSEGAERVRRHMPA